MLRALFTFMLFIHVSIFADTIVLSKEQYALLTSLTPTQVREIHAITGDDGSIHTHITTSGGTPDELQAVIETGGTGTHLAQINALIDRIDAASDILKDAIDNALTKVGAGTAVDVKGRVEEKAALVQSGQTVLATAIANALTSIGSGTATQIKERVEEKAALVESGQTVLGTGIANALTSIGSGTATQIKERVEEKAALVESGQTILGTGITNALTSIGSGTATQIKDRIVEKAALVKHGETVLATSITDTLAKVGSSAATPNDTIHERLAAQITRLATIVDGSDVDVTATGTVPSPAATLEGLIDQLLGATSITVNYP